MLGTGLMGACAPSLARTPPSREADVYAVSGLMVDDLRSGQQDRRFPVFLDTLATSAGPGVVQTPYDAQMRSVQRLFGVTDEMVSAFASPDSAPARVDPAVLARYTRVRVVRGTANARNLEELRREGRVGTVHLSLVAFNATRTLALVQGSWVCGPLCGHGSAAVMEKDASGRWRTKTTLMDMVF